MLLKTLCSGREKVLNAVLALLFLLILVLNINPFYLNIVYTDVYQYIFNLRYISGLQGYSSLKTDNFEIRYENEDKKYVEVVAEAAEKAYGLVVKDLNYRPSGRTLIVIYPDSASFNRSIGWKNISKTMGVYWAGSIRILSPEAWIYSDSDKSIKKEFWENGPLVHEFTHLLLDKKTYGNYPHWFTEGLAQYEEYRLTGVYWLENVYKTSTVFDYDQINENFTELEETAAYNQAFLMVSHISEKHGHKALIKITDRLAGGCTFDEAFKKVVGTFPENVFNTSFTIRYQ